MKARRLIALTAAALLAASLDWAGDNSDSGGFVPLSRDRVRVLLRLDAGKVDLTRKGVRRKDGDFAVAWARDYGRGRVVYSGLGHSPDAWERPEMQAMWLEMVRWSMGLTRADATPRRRPENSSR